MLRRNPQSGAWERLEGEQWVPAHNVDETGLDLALDDAFEEADTSAAHATGEATGEVTGGALAVAQSDLPAGPAPVSDAGTAVAQASPNGAALADGADGGGPAGALAGPADGSLDDWELPGLVSTEGARSVGGQRGLRKKLQDKLRGKRAGAQSSGTRKVEVGPRAAKATGPAVKEGTEARQTRRKVKGAQAAEGAKPQRYVTKPPPGLLANRPVWMRDLFEAHFRSELTLGMRKEYGRMKISRQDYAIGWLTLMDKIREDPSIARLKKDGTA